MCLPVTGYAHGVRVDLASRIAGLEFEYPIDLLDPHGRHEFVRLFQSAHRIGLAAQGADGTLHAMPAATGDLIQADAIAVIASIAEVTEKHLFFVRVVIAFGAIFAIGALPVIVDDESQ